MLKKLFLLAVVLVIGIIITNCSNDNFKKSETNEEKIIPLDEETPKPKWVMESSSEYLSFSEAIDLSDCIVIGEFLTSKITDWEFEIEYTFKVKEILRGNVPEEIIHVFELIGEVFILNKDYSYQTGKNIYEEGKEYILIMGRNNSLFLNYPAHGVICDIFIPLHDIGGSTKDGERLDEVADNGIEYFMSIVDNAKPKEKDDNVKYTKSTDRATIVNESDYILEVEITDSFIEGICGNSNTYYCYVNKIISGGDIFTDSNNDDKIMMVLMKGSVELGGTYVIMANEVGGAMYAQSSLDSIISIDDTKAIDEVIELSKNEKY